MNVSLTSKLERWIANKVAEGKYQTASEVVREAVRQLADREERRELELARLRRQVDIGLEDICKGRVAALDMKQIKAEARKELAARKLKRVGEGPLLGDRSP
jgi:antitoxin ParD1/3/4